MKHLLAGTMLVALALSPLPAFAHGGSVDPVCLPHDEALLQIAELGGHIIGKRTAPFSLHDDMLVYERKGLLFAAGVDANCVYAPAARIGRLAPALRSLRLDR